LRGKHESVNSDSDNGYAGKIRARLREYPSAGIENEREIQTIRSFHENSSDFAIQSGHAMITSDIGTHSPFRAGGRAISLARSSHARKGSRTPSVSIPSPRFEGKPWGSPGSQGESSGQRQFEDPRIFGKMKRLFEKKDAIRCSQFPPFLSLLNRLNRTIVTWLPLDGEFDPGATGRFCWASPWSLLRMVTGANFLNGCERTRNHLP
jgi:hypothetical protein